MLSLHLKHCLKYRQALKHGKVQTLDLKEVKRLGYIPKNKPVAKLTEKDLIYQELLKDEFTANQVHKRLKLKMSVDEVADYLQTNEDLFEMTKTGRYPKYKSRLPE